MKISHSGPGRPPAAAITRSSAASLRRAEVVRLPVVASAGRQQRIERGLEAGIGRRPERRADRIAELQHRRRGLLTGGDRRRSRPAARPPPRCRGPTGQEGQRRRLAQHRPHAQLVRGVGGEVAPRAQHLPRLRERVDDEAGVHLGADRMQLELERRDDAEVAAAAAQGPEQIGLRRRPRRCAARRRPSRPSRRAGCRSSGHGAASASRSRRRA